MDFNRLKNEADRKIHGLNLENSNLRARLDEMNANDLKNLHGKARDNSEMKRLVDLHENDLDTIKQLKEENKTLEELLNASNGKLKNLTEKFKEAIQNNQNQKRNNEIETGAKNMLKKTQNLIRLKYICILVQLCHAS